MVSYVFVNINLGKHEDLRPPELLDIINKQTRIPRDGIGDIKIRKSGTSFEVKETFMKKIFLLEGKKYKGVTIRVRKAKSLD